MEKKVINRTGTGFSGLFTIAFIVLKLCKVINWSWVWVLAPLWIKLGITLLILLVAVIIKVIADRY